MGYRHKRLVKRQAGLMSKDGPSSGLLRPQNCIGPHIDSTKCITAITYHRVEMLSLELEVDVLPHIPRLFGSTSWAWLAASLHASKTPSFAWMYAEWHKKAPVLRRLSYIVNGARKESTCSVVVGKNPM